MINITDITTHFDLNWSRFKDHIRKLEKTMPKAGGQMFSGWSVQSENGDYRSGWIDGSKYFITDEDNEVIGYNHDQAVSDGYVDSRRHLKITKAAGVDAIRAVITASQLGLQPARARLIQLVPGAKSLWHTDGTPENLILRLHLVIETNPGCWFIHEGGRIHMEEAHAYLVNVNEFHQVVNEGDTNRTHLVVDVFDTKKISKAHYAGV